MMRNPSPRLLIASILILISIGLLALHLAGFLQPAEDLITRPLTAVQGWIALRYNALRDLLTSPRDVAALQAEIARLESENARLQQEIVALREQAAEAQVLAALLDYVRAQPENRYLAANVIGRDVSPFLRSILIDKGSDAGVARGMPVVTARGLVGRVVEVFASYARVQLITDPATSVNVKFQSTEGGPRREGVLTARINGETFVDFIDLDVNIQEDELVLTSGLGGNYPADIPVGRVLSIRRRDFDLFQQATIQPSVDFESLDIVLVIVNFRPVAAQP